MRHLTADELLDYVERSPDAAALRGHVEACAKCRAEVEALAAILGAARRVPVPEPSPLFWDQFSDRVQQAIAAEPRGLGRATHWVRRPLFVPASALALLVLALVASVALPPGDAQLPNVVAEDDPTAGIVTAAAPDATWALVADLVGPIDLETAHQAGIVLGPGAADEVVLELSADEREELARLLRQELRQPGG